MSLIKDLDEIRRQMKSDYRDYMQAFSIQRDSFTRLEREFTLIEREFALMKQSSQRQERALISYQGKTGLIFDRMKKELLDFDKRITSH